MIYGMVPGAHQLPAIMKYAGSAISAIGAAGALALGYRKYALQRTRMRRSMI